MLVTVQPVAVPVVVKSLTDNPPGVFSKPIWKVTVLSFVEATVRSKPVTPLVLR